MPIKYTGADGKVEEVNINTPRGFYLYNKQRGNVPTGTNKTYWDNPARIARYYWYKKSLPSEDQTPDWMPANLDQTYKYLVEKNNGKPWYMWDELDEADPIVPEVRSWQAPPDVAQMQANAFHSEGRLDWQYPKPIDVPNSVQSVKYDANGKPIEIDANGKPIEQYTPEALPDVNVFGFDKTLWASLPLYKKLANMALATGPGQVLLGGIQGAGPLLATKNPIAIAGGFAFGTAAAGLNLVEQKRMQEMGENYTPGLAGKAMEWLDKPYRQVTNNLPAFLEQIEMSIEAPQKYGDLFDLFSNLKTNWEAGQGYVSSFGVKYTTGLNETLAISKALDAAGIGPVQLAKMSKEERDAFIAKATAGVENYLTYDPMDQPGQIRIDLPVGMTPTQYSIMQGREMLKAGMSPMEVQGQLMQLYGLGGQAADFIGGFALDPLNKAGAIANAGIGKAAKAAGNVTLETAAKMSIGPVDTLRNYGVLLRTKGLSETPTAVEIGKLDGFTRWLAGVDKEGKPSVTNLGTGKKLDPRTWFNLTPQARASEILANAATSLQDALLEGSTPSEMVGIVAAIGKVDPEAASRITSRLPWLESPEGASLPMALRDFVSLDDLNPVQTKPMNSTGGNLLDIYNKYEWQRSLINRIAADLDIDPRTMMRNIAAGEGDAILKQEAGILSQLVSKGDEGARKWLEAINEPDKPLTGKKLGEIVDNFKTNPFGPEEFRGRLYGALIDHMDKWAAKYFGIKPDPWWARLSQAVKATQSVFLLGLNPGYLMNNFINDAVTLAWGGVFGVRTEAQVTKFWDNLGVTPARLYSGVGISALGKDITLGEAVRAAGTDKGMLQKWANNMQSGVVKKAQVFSRMSGYVEGQASAQAFTAGTQQALNRLMVAGVGYDKLPDMLAKQLDAVAPGLSMVVESAIDASGGNGKMLDQIWESAERISMESAIPDIVKDLNTQGVDIDAGGIRDVLQTSGVYEFLSKELPKAKTNEQVGSIFSMAEETINRRLNELQRTNDRVYAEKMANAVKAEGYAGALNRYDNLFVDIGLFWIKHFADLETVFNDAEGMTRTQADMVIRRQLEIANTEWNRLSDKEADYLTGISRSLGANDNDVAAMNHNFLNTRDVWGNFYAERRRAWDEYFNAEYKNKAERSAAYLATLDKLDKLYGDCIKAEDALQAETDSIFARLFEKQLPGEGAKASEWRKSVRTKRRSMANEMRTFRASLRDMNPAEKNAAWGAFINGPLKQKILDWSHANQEGGRGMYDMQAKAEVGGVQEHIKWNTIAELRTRLAVAGIGNDTQWNAQYKSLSKYLDPSDPPFNELDYNNTPSAEWLARFDKAVAKRDAELGAPAPAPKPTMPETAQEVGAQVAAREKYKWYAGQKGVQEVDGDQIRTTLRQSWLDMGYEKRDVDAVVAVMDARAELQARQQGKTVAQWYADAWAGGTLELPDFGDPAFQTLFQTAPKVGTPEYASFIQGSKLLDDNGNPIHLWHGAIEATFDDFDVSRDTGKNLLGRGIYLTTDEEIARSHAFSHNATKPGLYETIVRMEKPLDLTDENAVGRFASEAYDLIDNDNGYKYGLFGPEYYRVKGQLNAILYGSLNPTQETLLNGAFQMNGQIINRMARDLGYDGIVFKGTQYTESAGRTPTVYVAFDGEQVANVKVDTFFQSEKGKSWYYSQLQAVIEQKMPNKASKEQIKGLLAGQVKADELGSTGFNKWLDEQKGSVTKQDVMDYLQENQIDVQEKVLSKSMGSLYRTHYREGGREYIEYPDTGYRIRQEDDGTYQIEYDNRPVISYANVDDASEYVDRAIADTKDQTKYSGYVLPGGTNYRELLITLPVKKVEYKNPTIEEYARFYGGNPTDPGMITEYRRDLSNGRWAQKLLAETGNVPESHTYTSPHWSEPNVLAHTRFDDRVDADGKRVLFVEEIQSDWHQAGRENGYKGDWTPEELELKALNDLAQGNYSALTPEQLARRNELVDRNVGINLMRRERDAVPSAPFSKNWEELTIKRIIRWAAENGYERVAFPTGPIAARIEGHQLITDIQTVRMKPGSRTIEYLKTGQAGFSNKEMEAGKTLKDYIGFDAAKQLEEAPVIDGIKTLETKDIVFGGEKMRWFYDDKLINVINKYVKKWGAKVGETKIAGDAPVKGWTIEFEDGTRHNNTWDDRFIPESIAKKNGGKVIPVSGGETVHSFDITPDMRKSVMEQGQPLFQRNAAATTFLPDGRAVFSALGTSRNITQLVHEVGHVFRRQLTDNSVNGYIKYLKREYDVDVSYDAQTGKFNGVGMVTAEKAPWLDAGGSLDVATWAEEVFARGFERYLREGRAPTSAMRTLFRNFRNWMMEIYRSIKGSDVDVVMTDELRSIFDKMFTEKPDKRFSGKYIDDLIGEYKGDKARLYKDIFSKFRTKKEAIEAAKRYEIEQRPVEATLDGSRLLDWSTWGEALDDIEAHPELDPFADNTPVKTREEKIAELNKGINGARNTLAENMNIPKLVADKVGQMTVAGAQNIKDMLPGAQDAVSIIRPEEMKGGGYRQSNNPLWYQKLNKRYEAQGQKINRQAIEHALERVINGDDTIKWNDRTIIEVKQAIWDYLTEPSENDPNLSNIITLLTEPLPRDLVAQGKMKEAAQQVQKWMMTDVAADLTEADWAQLVGDVDTFSKLLDYDIEADLPGDVSAQAIADVQRGNPVDVDTASRVGDKAMVLRLAQEFGIPTATKAGKPMDKAALNIINKRQPEGQKYASLSEVPADVAEQAFRDHKAKYEVVEPQPVEVEQVARVEETTPMAQTKPMWAGDKVTEYNGQTFRNGRFGNTKDKWALDIDGKLSSGYYDTPEAALAYNAQVKAAGAEAQAAHESWNSVVERIKSGEITAKNASEADAKKLTGGYGRVTKTQGTSLLRALGLTATEARRVMNAARQGGESSGGATLFYLGDVLEAYDRLHTPAAPAPLPELPKKAEPTFAKMKSGQTTMFGAGEDTPLFSGTPMTAKQETFTPKETGGQDALFATGEYLQNIEPKQGGDESGLFANTDTLFQGGRDTNTPEFKRWFGDSKVVDESGKPLRVHHRTSADFNTFDKNKTQDSLFWFTALTDGETGEAGSTVDVPVYLRIEKMAGWDEYDKYTTDQLIQMGYDGIKLDDDYVVFEPEQIKSVFNRGTFDPNDPRILYQSSPSGRIITESIQPDTHGGTRIVANVYREVNGQRELIGYLPEAFSTAQWQDSSSGRFHIIGLDVNEPNKWLIEFEDGHTDTLDRNAQPAAAINAPIGTMDQIDPNPPVAEALNEANGTMVQPILNALKKRMTQPDATTPQKLKGAQANLSPELKQQVSAHVAKVKGQMSSAKLAAIRIGETKRDFALLNYSHRTNMDTLLTAIFPYQFWGTRTMMNWALRFMDRPSILANYARYQMLRERNEQKGMPSRLAGKIAIPNFFTATGDDFIFIDPARQIFPWENFYKPLEMLSSNKNKTEKRATQIVNDWLTAETISKEKAAVALTKKGADWERAVAQANQELADDLDKPYDIMTSLFSPALPVTNAYYAATGQKDRIGKLPFTRLIEGITGKMGNAIDIEGPIRKGLGIDSSANVGAFESSWQDWEIDRMLSNMVGDGTIDAQTSISAMIDRQGEAYDEASKRIGEERGIKTMLPGFFADLYPEGEKNQRQLAAEYSKSIDYKKAGDTDAISKFFDAHPDYEARLASFKEPEERLHSFLVGQVWDRYNTLSKIEKQAMRDGLGDQFNDAFINSETRSYDAIDNETLAAWVKTMNGKLPESVKAAAMPVTMPDSKTVQASEAFYNERDARFPGISEKLTEYYATENGTVTPELAEYFRWKDRKFAENPELIKYMTSEENELSGLPQDIQQYVYAYRVAKEDQFPGIYDVQDAYFKITDNKAKTAFRNAHPELAEYWTWRRDYAANYPKAAAYILSDESLSGYIRGDTYSTSSGSKQYDTYTKPVDYRAPFLTPDEIAKFEPGLIRQIYAYVYGNTPLGAGALRELRQLKTDFGISGDLDEFIDLYVKPAVIQ